MTPAPGVNDAAVIGNHLSSRQLRIPASTSAGPAHRRCIVRTHEQVGFTLIELLAVVLILGLVSSTLVVSLTGADQEAKLQSAGHAVWQLDAEARLIARSNPPTIGGSISLRIVAPNGKRSALQIIRSDAADLAIVMRELQTPPNVIVRFLEVASPPDPIAAAQSITFDRRGCSNNYLIECASEPGALRRWLVNGQNGVVKREIRYERE